MHFINSIIVILLVSVCLVSAQTKPDERTIAGLVVDKDGLPIAGVNFYVKNGDAKWTFPADIDGKFTLKLPVGSHEITVIKSNGRDFRLYLTVPESGPVPSNLNIVLDPNSSCCVSDAGLPYPKPTSLPKPPYPPAARAVRATGEVEVEVKLNADGSVETATALGGHPLLRRAAEAAGKRARFEPVASGNSNNVILVYVFLNDSRSVSTPRHKNGYRIDVISDYVVISN